jgi:hypothetical protein
VDAELLLGGHLGGQAVAVPAEAALHPVAPHGLVAGDHVLHVAGEQVAVVGEAVGEGRTVVEHVGVVGWSAAPPTPRRCRRPPTARGSPARSPGSRRGWGPWGRGDHRGCSRWPSLPSTPARPEAVARRWQDRRVRHLRFDVATLVGGAGAGGAQGGVPAGGRAGGRRASCSGSAWPTRSTRSPPSPQGRYRVDLTTLDGGCSGSAVLVRSHEGVHVLRGDGPLGGHRSRRAPDRTGRPGRLRRGFSRREARRRRGQRSERSGQERERREQRRPPRPPATTRGRRGPPATGCGGARG